MGYEHKYSNNTHPTSEWTAPITGLCEKLNRDLKTSFNSCFLNRYRDGNDYIADHSDVIKDLRCDVIAAVSLGGSRTMVLSEKDGKRKIKVELGSGSLFVMEGDTQKCWRHGIPREGKVKEERVSLTFREFVEEYEEEPRKKRKKLDLDLERLVYGDCMKKK